MPQTETGYYKCAAGHGPFTEEQASIHMDECAGYISGVTPDEMVKLKKAGWNPPASASEAKKDGGTG